MSWKQQTPLRGSILVIEVGVQVVYYTRMAYTTPAARSHLHVVQTVINLRNCRFCHRRRNKSPPTQLEDLVPSAYNHESEQHRFHFLTNRLLFQKSYAVLIPRWSLSTSTPCGGRPRDSYVPLGGFPG